MNLFRHYTSFVKNNLISHLTDEQLDSDLYVRGSIPQSWKTIGRNPKIRKIETGDYEERLIEFMETPSPDLQDSPLVVIRGGIGSGKTTAIRYALKHSYMCHNCTEPGDCDRQQPFVVHVDMYPADQEHFRPPSESKTLADEGVDEQKRHLHDESPIWMMLDDQMRSHMSGEYKLSEEEELTLFWGWLSRNRSVLNNALLRKSLRAQEHNLEKSSEHLDEIRKERQRFFRNATERDQCYYTLMMLRYFRRKMKGHCHLVILDNVDSLSGEQQREILGFATDMHLILGCKILVGMRPYTVSLNSNSTGLIEVIEHESPEPLKVVRKRIKHLKHKQPEIGRLLERFFRILLEKIDSDRHMKKIVEATCGWGVRYAQRNFFNLTLSPLLIAEEDGSSNINDWTTNEFYQAYFCSETTQQLMYRENFNNILMLTTKEGTKTLSNIKLRILHHLYVADEQAILVRDLAQDMTYFGYRKNDITAAVNDMLRKRTPLVWSEAKDYYKTSELGARHGLMLSPLGRNYYEFVVRDPLYIRECVFDLDGARQDGLEVFLPRCIDVLKQLGANDFRETVQFLERRSLFLYNRVYGSIFCIGKFLWDELGPRFSALAEKTQIEIDKLYGEFIWYRLMKRLEGVFIDDDDGESG